jgi:hypothetical protein
MYVFAVDHIRHYAVYTHGGIYLDTDIEVVKSFDELLDTDLLPGYTSYSENNGLVQEFYGFSHESSQMLRKMRGILPFLSGSCSKTSVFEQL